MDQPAHGLALVVEAMLLHDGLQGGKFVGIKAKVQADVVLG